MAKLVSTLYDQILEDMNTHFKNQPKDVQDRIKYHVKHGKTYWEAFRAAKHMAEKPAKEQED